MFAEDTTAAAVEVVGYWMTLDITSLKYDPPNQLISLKSGKSEPSIGKKGNITAGMLEELVTSTKQSKSSHFNCAIFQFDAIFIDDKNLVPSRYMRTRFIKFKVGNTILNEQEIAEDPEVEQEVSLRVVMEVQFAKPEGKLVMTLDDFKDVVNSIITKNNTLSVTEMPYFQYGDTLGITVSNNCSETACPIKEAPTCVNDDFTKIPDDLIFRHKNMTKMVYPYNVSVAGEAREYVGKVGETLDFVCKADKKVFKTEVAELLDSVLTVVCKTDRYYTVPSSGVSNSALINSTSKMCYTVGDAEALSY